MYLGEYMWQSLEKLDFSIVGVHKFLSVLQKFYFVDGFSFNIILVS